MARVTTHQIRRVWKDPNDPTARRDIHGPWFDCPTCPPPATPESWSPCLEPCCAELWHIRAD